MERFTTLARGHRLVHFMRVYLTHASTVERRLLRTGLTEFEQLAARVERREGTGSSASLFFKELGAALDEWEGIEASRIDPDRWLRGWAQWKRLSPLWQDAVDTWLEDAGLFV
jgi:hypothetical protein